MAPPREVFPDMRTMAKDIENMEFWGVPAEAQRNGTLDDDRKSQMAASADESVDKKEERNKRPWRTPTVLITPMVHHTEKIPNPVDGFGYGPS